MAVASCPWHCEQGWQPRRRRDGTAYPVKDRCGGCNGKGYIIVNTKTRKRRRDTSDERMPVV